MRKHWVGLFCKRWISWKSFHSAPSLVSLDLVLVQEVRVSAHFGLSAFVIMRWTCVQGYSSFFEVYHDKLIYLGSLNATV